MGRTPPAALALAINTFGSLPSFPSLLIAPVLDRMDYDFTALSPPTEDQPAPALKECSKGHMAPISEFVGVYGASTKLCKTHRDADKIYKENVS